MFKSDDNVVDEPVLFMRQEDGTLKGRLLFKAVRISSIKSWNGERDGGYEECPNAASQASLSAGIGGHGSTITIPPRTCKGVVPSLRTSDLEKPLGSLNSYPSTRDGKRGLLFSEDGLFLELQALVTYETREEWGGYLPTRDDGSLQVVKHHLQAGKGLDVFVIGDSISFGCNASAQLDLPPQNGAYPDVLVDLMKSTYPDCKIRLKNESVGGTNSKWGKKTVSNILKEGQDFNHDLNIIAFGANDSAGKMKPKAYRKNVEGMMKAIIKANADAEFILVASSLPNEAWIHTHHSILLDYVSELKILQVKYAPIVGIVNMTAIWQELLKRKNYHDLTGNGINHPNDYGHRLHALAIAIILGAIK
ncbi:MAG: SGNH/GDSL hydrolase family protein [Promethearchaeota archaeon]